LIETLPAPDRAWVIAGGAIAALQALLALGLMTSPKK